jgi:hypothetical protein
MGGFQWLRAVVRPTAPLSVVTAEAVCGDSISSRHVDAAFDQASSLTIRSRMALTTR